MSLAKSLVSLVMLGVVFVASSATAESLEDKEKWARQDSYMKDSVESANKGCGLADASKLTYAFDKKSFEKEDWSSHSPNGYCSGVFDDLTSLCASADGKEAVQKNVKRVVCRYAGKGKFGMSLKKGVLTYNIDWDEPNVHDKITGYLKKNL